MRWYSQGFQRVCYLPRVNLIIVLIATSTQFSLPHAIHDCQGAMIAPCHGKGMCLLDLSQKARKRWKGDVLPCFLFDSRKQLAAF